MVSKTKCPSETRDRVRNPGHYYSRKGFHALNVQVIVNKDKKILCRCINSRVGSNDSNAFNSSLLYEYLTMNYK